MYPDMTCMFITHGRQASSSYLPSSCWSLITRQWLNLPISHICNMMAQVRGCWYEFSTALVKYYRIAIFLTDLRITHVPSRTEGKQRRVNGKKSSLGCCADARLGSSFLSSLQHILNHHADAAGNSNDRHPVSHWLIPIHWLIPTTITTYTKLQIMAPYIQVTIHITILHDIYIYPRHNQY
jgi:hypothetical protein